MSETSTSESLPLDALKGIAIFIDDELDQEKTDAFQLKQQIIDKKIPYIVRDKIPEPIDAFVKHLYGVSFIILDWKFYSSPTENEQKEQGNRFPESLGISATIDFLENVLKTTYCPIFIVSQESIDSIKNELDKNKITIDGVHPRIFVCDKSELSDGCLFSRLNEWIEKRPITYVLKTWEMAAKDAKLEMFSNLEKKNVRWPQVLWESFKNDNSDPEAELTQVLSTIFANRFQFSCNFNSDNLINSEEDHRHIDAKDDIRCVLEETHFLSVSDNMKPAPGDLFEFFNGTKTSYYLNFRAQCSTLRSSPIELYCIRGMLLEEESLQSSNEVSFDKGEFRTKKQFVILPFVHGKKILKFDCNEIEILRFDKTNASLYAPAQKKNIYKGKRVGRILPPYITHVQQVVSSYIIREGLPAIPNEAIVSETTSTDDETGDDLCLTSFSKQNTRKVNRKAENSFLKRWFRILTSLFSA